VTSVLTYSAATLITIEKSFRGQASRITKKFRGVFEKFLTSFVIIVGFSVVVVVVFWLQRRFSKDFSFSIWKTGVGGSACVDDMSLSQVSNIHSLIFPPVGT